MKIHLLGLPHTETTKAYSWCAYTQKIRKLADMLDSLGYDVRLYAAQDNEANVTEHIAVIDKAWQHKHFGNYNWGYDVFNDFDPSRPHWVDFNARIIKAMQKRWRTGDILGITMGYSHKSVADAFPSLLSVEVGVGYSGIWAPYRVYESYAWAHHLAGLYREDAVRFYDAIIPNSFEEQDFPHGKGGDSFVFVGRFIRQKGVQIAVEATERLGKPLIMAGQGVSRNGEWYQGIDINVKGKHLSHIGVVNPAERAKLMGEARAVFVPTQYLEPFGGVAVEAMMCGTPVITTDWGAFTETVQHGVTGFRCNTLAEFVEAGRNAGDLDRQAIRDYAIGRYSTNVIRHQYDNYLRRLGTLSGAGWYT